MTEKNSYTKEETYMYLGEARVNMGDKKFMTNPDRVTQMQKFLAHLYFYCPEDISMTVYSTMEEVTAREMYMVARA